jgi:hypothetical protein
MYAREVVRAVQNERKSAGLEVEDRIALTLGGDGTLLDAARAHEPYIAGEVLAVEVAYDGNGTGSPRRSRASSCASRSPAPRLGCPNVELPTA